MFTSSMFVCSLVIIIIIIIVTTLIRPSQQGIFDTFTGAFDLYDGMQCSLHIIEEYLDIYNRPMCCLFWKVKQILGHIATKKCETPENIHNILSGQTLKNYVDFSRMDCSKYPENSPQCDYLWLFVMFITFGQIFLLITFILTTIILYWLLRRSRRFNHHITSSPPSSSSLSPFYGYKSDYDYETSTSTLSSESIENFNNNDQNDNPNGWNSVTKLLTL